MIKRALALAVVVAVAGVTGLLLGLHTVTATEHPERLFSEASVLPDSEVEVTIERVGAVGLSFRQVVETLPDGFTYVEDSAASPDAGAHINAAWSPDTNEGQVHCH